MQRQRNRAQLVLLAVLLISTSACTGRPRSESWLRSHFAENRDAFERLADMSNEDFDNGQVIRIADDFTRLIDNWSWPRPEAEWGVTPQRWNEYRALFRSLKLPAGLSRQGDDYGLIMLMMHGIGLAGEGSETGYLWSREMPQQIDDDQQFLAVIQLEGNWYLYEWDVY